MEGVGRCVHVENDAGEKVKIVAEYLENVFEQRGNKKRWCAERRRIEGFASKMHLRVDRQWNLRNRLRHYAESALRIIPQ